METTPFAGYALAIDAGLVGLCQRAKRSQAETRGGDCHRDGAMRGTAGPTILIDMIIDSAAGCIVKSMLTVVSPSQIWPIGDRPSRGFRERLLILSSIT